MKNNFFAKSKIIILFGIFLLMVANIYMVSQGVVLSDKLAVVEDKIINLKVENQKLRKKLYTTNSLRNIEKNADKLGFTNKSIPVYLNNPDYAFAN